LAVAELIDTQHRGIRAAAGSRLRAFHGLLPGHLRHFRVSGVRRPPQFLWAGDAERARRMLKGEFTFAGETTCSIPGRIFSASAPSPAWRKELLALAWLTDFMAGDREFSRIVARSMIVEWARQPMRTMDGETRVRALMALAIAAQFLSQGASKAFLSVLYEAVTRLAAWNAGRHRMSPELAFKAAIALHYAAVAYHMPRMAQASAAKAFAENVDAVVLPDGGHVSRNSSETVELVALLDPLRDALAAERCEIPQPLVTAADRMTQMLGMLSDEQGRIGGFQGAVARHRTRSRRARDAAEPMALAPHAGFARLRHDDSLLLMDVGQPARCRGTLSFELTDGRQPLIVNCGWTALSEDWAAALSRAAACSTLEIEDFSQSASHAVSARHHATMHGALVSAADAMKHRYEKLTHRRTLFLSADGADFRGEDAVDGTAGKFSRRNLVLRFHLHPAVKPVRGSSGATVSLILPDENIWSFRHAGGLLAIEDSIYAEGAAPQPSQQIVIRSALGSKSVLKWCFRRSPRAAQAGYMKRKA
jgi:uncharacterized heparinase superfamily protein